MATNKDAEQCSTLPKLKETDEELVNVAEILQDYKEKEIMLYTTMYGNAFFKGFTSDGGIILENVNTIISGCLKRDVVLDKYGKMKEAQGGECILFPSSDMRDWNKMFKNGDVLVNKKDGSMFVFDCWAKGDFTKMSIIDYFDKPSSFGGNEYKAKHLIVDTKDYQKVNEEQREWFFELMAQSYTFVVDCGRMTMVDKKVPDFNPYDKVLVRNRRQSWKIDLFSHYNQFGIYHYRTLGGYYEYCIPFKGNEHLIGMEIKDEEE